MKKTEIETERKFQERMTEDLFGQVEHDTLEKALEKALDSTTVETPGDPRDFRDPRPAESEWL
jgi:hypothetical protein